MNRLMNRTASNALADADLVLFVSDATRWTEEDDDVLQRLTSARSPVIALLNKVDKVHPKEKLLESLKSLSSRFKFAEVVPISAIKTDNLPLLMDMIPKLLAGVATLVSRRHVHGPQRAVSCRRDHSRKADTATAPGNAVRADRPGRAPGAGRDEALPISAIIWVERDSQKGIAIGKNGSVLKKVGRAARLDIAKHLGQPIHLELFVKVKSNWADNEKDLINLGYE